MNDLELKITNPQNHIKKGISVSEKYSPQQKGKLAKASKDFESMLTTMMIKSMTKTTDGLFGKENYGGDVLDVLFETEMAKHITDSKGMGIADKIFSSMTGENLKKFENDNQSKSIEKSNLFKGNSSSLKSEDIKSPVEKISPSNKSLQRIDKYDHIIKDAAEKYDLDEKLIKSVILTESAGRADAKSKANAKGLMQLMDSTATDMGVKDSWDPKDNINGGTKYLSKLLNQFDGEVDLALAAYNAGPGNVNKYNGIPPFKETQAYVKRVNNYLNILD